MNDSLYILKTLLQMLCFEGSFAYEMWLIL